MLWLALVLMMSAPIGGIGFISPVQLHAVDNHAGASRSADLTQTDPSVVIRLVAEAGFLGVIDHRIRYSEADSAFLYHKDGGQDVLFPFARLSAELELNQRHTAVFLYQPLEIETRVDMPAGLQIDGEPFAGDSLRLLYSFPFYRLSYLYRFLHGDTWWVEAGGSLQIRNANTEFEARGSDGSGGTGEPGVASGFYRSAGTGPVPLLKLRGRYDLPHGFWLGLEADGIYAPISYLNGSDNETVGALLDASLRAGYRVNSSMDTFVNVRYLGGGAANEDPKDYTVNWLHTYTVSLGAVVSTEGRR
ncbi:MAG: hypothetical protein EA428_06690 [Spirochaetaceae bacterium]|nr:MAG: hypothetical protein EA428_06690 [Spirochaetaceae bacterium]